MVLVQVDELQNPRRDNVLGLNLDLLRPRMFSEAEKSRRWKQIRRLVWACLAVLVWSVGLYWSSEVSSFSLLLQVRKLEKETLAAKMSALESSGEPAEVQKAREELHNQPNWARRLLEINGIVPQGYKVTQISVKKDGSIELEGEVPDVKAYGLLLESLKQVGFIKEIVSASLVASDGGFSFKVVATTIQVEGAQDSAKKN